MDSGTFFFSKEVSNHSGCKLSWDNCIFDLLDIKISEDVEDFQLFTEVIGQTKNNTSVKIKKIDTNKANNG